MLEYFMLNGNKITKWKSKGLSNECLEVIPTSDNTLTPSINYYGDKAKIYRKRLTTKTITYRHKKVVDLYVVYEITVFYSRSNDPGLGNALFGAAKLTKNADIDKY